MIRDKKTFILEIVCPIILVLIGLGVSSVTFDKSTPSSKVDFTTLPNPVKIMINSYMPDGVRLPSAFSNIKTDLVEATYDDMAPGVNNNQNVKNYLNELNRKNVTDSYGSYYIMKLDQINNSYEFVTFINTQAKGAAVVFPQYLMNQIHSYAASRSINVEVIINILIF